MRIGSVSIEGASVSENSRLVQCAALVPIALNDPGVRDLIRHHEFAEALGFANTDDTPEQILAKNDAAPWNVRIRLYTPSFWQRWSSAVASTDPTTGIISLNRAYLNGPLTTDADIAGTIAHEYQHVLGYEHDFKATWRRPFSEPYAIGDQVVAFLKASGLSSSTQK
jgi:hypothetical protein